MHEDRLANVKKEIRSVIITYPKGVTLNAFLKTYHQLVGVRLPSREFGFTSDADFLYSLTDTVKVRTDRNGDILLNCIADENTEHIQKLVLKQRTVKTKTKNAFDRGHREKQPTNSPRTKPFVSATLRKNLFEVLKDYPDGINYNSLLLAYQRKFKRPLNLEFLSDSCYDRLRKLEIAVSELYVKEVDDTERLFYCPLKRKSDFNKHEEINNKVPAQSSHFYNSLPPKNPNGENKETEDIPIIPHVIKEDFEKVLKLYPDGLLARHFPFLYEKITGEMFDLADLGFNNFLELADALPDVFICVKPYESPNEWMIFHRCFSESAEKLRKLNEALQLSHERFGSATEIHKQEPPSDITLQPYKPAEFPRDVNLSLYIPVFISAATNPGCFWFKLQIEEVICRFKEMEDEMQCFYHSQKAEAYQMSEKDIKIGATCVAMHEDHWYRTTITSSLNAELVNVYLVDYGSWERVHYSKLRYLKHSFISLPSQAFKAHLALIKPVDNSKTWCKKATVRFLQLCVKTYIMAQVHLEFDDTLSVFLCDTSGDDDIYINDILVDENLAESYSADNFSSVEKSSVYETHSRAANSVRIDSSANDYTNICTDSQRLQVNGKDQNPPSNCSTLLKRVHLGDGYWTNMIKISESAYITASDLCCLFWPDKPAEVLKSRLQCRNVEIPPTTILRDEHKDLFLVCEKEGVHGFSPLQESVEVYPLSTVMKVLNSLGHPSVEVRESIQTALKDRSGMNDLFRKSTNSHDTIVNRRNLAEDISYHCLYDLKAMHEAVKFKRLMLQTKFKQTSQSEVEKELQKVETLLEAIRERIKDINFICLSYSNCE